MREEGFYWIKIGKGEDWTVAEWSHVLGGCWWLTGSEQELCSEPYEVDEKKILKGE